MYCRSISVDETVGGDRDRPPLPVAEREANAFAAALLMPARLVRQHYRRGLDFFALCDLFGASGSAMGKCLHAVI